MKRRFRKFKNIITDVLGVIFAIVAIPLMILFYVLIIALVLLAVCSPIILIMWMILQAI